MIVSSASFVLFQCILGYGCLSADFGRPAAYHLCFRKRDGLLEAQHTNNISQKHFHYFREVLACLGFFFPHDE